MKHPFSSDTKVTRFRTWKSGKIWLVGASVLALGFFGQPVQALAEGATEPETTLLDNQDPPTDAESPQALEDEDLVFTANAVTVAAETADQILNTPQEVRIHYTPNKGDTGNYYAWVWGDDAAHKDKGRFLELTADNDGKRTLTLTPDTGVESFNYIITNSDNWDNKPTKVSGDQDMIAPVNKLTATDIYHGADGWYSQFHNIQTPEFDQKFGYKDKIVTEDGQFETVGQAGNLGATLNEDGTATINLWAPTAEKVELNVYRSHDENADLLKTLTMTRGDSYNPDDHTKNTIGLWSVTLGPEDLGNDLTVDKIAYDYKLTIPKAYFIQKTEDWREDSPGKWAKYGDKYINSASATKTQAESVSSKESIANIAKLYVGPAETVITQDPYSQATVKNGKRSVIVDPSKIGSKVTTTKNVRVNSKTELSVLEVDVRDFSIDPSSGVSDKNKGNYLGFVEAGTTDPTTGKPTGIDYLKYLGAKYIQMMPIYDYQTVPELAANDPANNTISKEFSATDQQNWGYDPKNYNVPEGSYATDPANPSNRIAEVKEMVQKLHDAGINIIMDVVYNHLYDGQNNPFEYTVPGYYYAINGDGKMNNDVGVGNAVRTNSEMMRQYIVNSVAYWALEYGMDGFRFDAMSDLDTDTMNAIRDAINKIDKRIVTYGEGWNSMGNYLPKDGDTPASVANASKTPEVGFFDSVGRDAIAGSHYDNENPAGFVNRNSDFKHNKDKITTLVDSLMGGHGRSFINASQQLNYVEVHDGMTLSDLLKHYNPSDTDAEHLNRVELATAMSALSQGIHFSQHGQEFLRSKMNSHNTYNAGDEKNKINWGLIAENADAVNFTKSLLSLRQNEPLWHLNDYKNEVFKHMTITNAQTGSGIVTYELKQDNGDKYLVVFNNNTASDPSLTLGGDNYYYGTDKTRGQINSDNDFSKAFIVTTNSKNLYSKIGQENGDKTITLDKLSATVLYIPAVRKTQQETKTQTIHYVNKQGETLVADKTQTVTAVTVEQTDTSKKFSYVASGIGAKNESVLGHRDNILDGVNKENAVLTTTYYATDADGNWINFDGEVELDATGKPRDTDTVKWMTSENPNFKEVAHPEVENYQVINNSETSKDLTKVPELAISDQEWTVTYAKKAKAYLISDNDPEKLLPTSKEDSLTKTETHFAGVEGDNIVLSEDGLARAGYTYTVNGQANLATALAAQPQLGQEDLAFTVNYAPNEAKIAVVYKDVDNNNTVIKQAEVTGKVDQDVTFTKEVPENYVWQNDDSAKVTKFDKSDDTNSPSQTITVYVKQKHEQSTLQTTHTIHYTGTNETINDAVVTIDWDVDHNIVTGVTTYTPTTEAQTVDSPVVEGYEPDADALTITPRAGTEEPQNVTLEVVYTPNDATVKVVYVDAENNAVVKETSIAGKVDQAVTFTKEVPDNYDWQSDNSSDVTTFDKADDTDSPSQIITVYVKQKHETSALQTTHTIHYTGTAKAIDDAVVTIEWTVDHNLVTGEKTYTPKTENQEVRSPSIVGYRPNVISLIIEPQQGTKEPHNVTREVVYTAVPKPDTSFTTVETYEIDDQLYDKLPEGEQPEHLRSEIITEGRDSAYEWDFENEDWVETQAAINKEIRHYYRRREIIPALTIGDIAIKHQVGTPETVDLPEGIITEVAVGTPETIVLPDMDIVVNSAEEAIVLELPSLDIRNVIIKRDGLTVYQTLAVTLDAEGNEIHSEVIEEYATSLPVFSEKPELKSVTSAQVLTQSENAITHGQPNTLQKQEPIMTPRSEKTAMETTSSQSQQPLPITGEVTSLFGMLGASLLGLMRRGRHYQKKLQDL